MVDHPNVSTANFLPSKYFENFSHAHVRANASFSICAYRCSVSVRDREATIRIVLLGGELLLSQTMKRQLTT